MWHWIFARCSVWLWTWVKFGAAYLLLNHQSCCGSWSATHDFHWSRRLQSERNWSGSLLDKQILHWAFRDERLGVYPRRCCVHKQAHRRGGEMADGDGSVVLLERQSVQTARAVQQTYSWVWVQGCVTSSGYACPLIWLKIRTKTCLFFFLYEISLY